MRKLIPKLAAATLSLFAIAVTARADSIVYNFDNGADYVVNGVVGLTNWDGVYLRYGDVPGGTSGSGGAGNTTVANENTIPGYLAVQSTGTSWAGAEDDGFFLYKVVAGDFDVSVQIAYPFPNPVYHMPGLLVRAYNPDNSGAPYSAVVTNSVENFLSLARFQEYNQGEHARFSEDGADHDATFTTPGDNSDTNTIRYVRITRTGNTFTFYNKTNQFDSWNMMGSTNLAGLEGVSMQVGIEDAYFTGNSGLTLLTDFELSGTNVTFPVMPAAASSLVTTATNTSGSLTFAWTKGNASDNSLVVIRQNGPIQHNPINGHTYNASPGFGDASAYLGGANEFVVYNGTGTSVTVTNLGPYTVPYTVAVYEYSGSGSDSVYNTVSPATNVFPGPGVVNGVAMSINSTNLPVGGAVKGRLLATFSTGQSDLDVSLDPLTVWATGDGSILTVDNTGSANGVGTGSTSLSVTYGGTFSASTNVTVHGPVAFTDTFGATNDYLANGIMGSAWEGFYAKYGDIPGGAPGGDGAGSTTIFDSQVTSTNGLTLNSVQSTWQGSGDDGPFLFKIVPGVNSVVSGDFQAAVHLSGMNALNGVAAGLMARLYNPANHGPGPGARENHVNYWKIQNGSTSVRRIRNNSTTTVTATGPLATDAWLLMQRVNSTNFYFFEKVNEGDQWTYVTNTVLDTAVDEAPMEVGIAQQSTAGVNGVATFDSFWLDAAGVNVGTAPAPASEFAITLNPDLSMTLNWVAADGSGNPIPSIVVMRADAPVSARPNSGASVTGNSVFGQGSNLSDGNYVVFVSDNPPASTNNTVTVTGLTAGVTYYAAVFTFSGSGASTTYSVLPTSGASAVQVDGTLVGLVVPQPPSIPMGGIGKLQGLAAYGSGALTAYIDVSSSLAVTSGDTNVVRVLGGVMTGIANGTAQVSASFGGFTNTLGVTVRSPVFTDNFGVNHDYLNNGVAGTGWQGMYSPGAAGTQVPDSPYVPLALSGTTVADANISSNGVLTVSSAGDGWENAAAGGFFLFRYVPGDFQMAVHIQTMDIATFNQPGLMARAYGVDTNGNIGTPFGVVYTNASGTYDLGEYWVSFVRFDEYNIGTYARRNIDSGVSQNTQTDPGPTAINGPTGSDTNYWLLIVRSGNGTEFDFYKRSGLTDTWRQVPNKTHYSLSQFAGQPMQVGLMGGPWTGGSGTQRSVQFANFMLDTTTGSPLQVMNAGDGNVILSWPAIPNAQLQSTSSLEQPDWQNVPGTPVLGPNGYSLGVPIGPNNVFFRLKQ